MIVGGGVRARSPKKGEARRVEESQAGWSPLELFCIDNDEIFISKQRVVYIKKPLYPASTAASCMGIEFASHQYGNSSSSSITSS